MERDGALVAEGRDRLELPNALPPAVVFESRIEHPPDAAPPMLRVDADKVDIADQRVTADEAEQKTRQHPFALYDPREPAELVEEDRMSECARRSSPPTIDHSNDL